jgi:hypothetical protein
MGSAGRTAGRDGTRLINKLSLALRRRRLSEGLGERVGRLLSCLSRQAATVGASSAAIFATAMSASGKAGALVSSDAVAAASFAGDKASSVVATLVSSAAASA